MGREIITYKGKEITYLDYRGKSIEEIKAILVDAVEQALAENKQRNLLTNITGIFAVPEFMEVVNDATRKTRHLTIKSAVVGVTGAKKLLFNIYNTVIGKEAKAFDDETSAKEWLIKD
jgi:hypothetical protein